MISLQSVLLALLPALVAGSLAYFLGLLRYRHDKEHELVLRRYLFESVDIVIANLDKQLTTLRENISTMQQAVHLQEMARARGFADGKPAARQQLIPPDPTHVVLAPLYRLQVLTQKAVFHKAQDSMASDVFTTHVAFQGIIAAFDRNYETREMDPKESFETVQRLIRNQEKKLTHYANIIWALQRIGSVLEVTPRRLKDVDSIKTNAEVLDAVRQAEDQLEAIEQLQKNPTS